MFLVPYRRTSIISAAPASVFITRLRATTTAKHQWFRSVKDRYEFVGTISDHSFRIVPTIHGRNTYLPLVIGTIQAKDESAEITITQLVHPIALAILLFFIGGFAFLALRHSDIRSVLGGLAIFTLFHILMYFFGFVPEAREVERRLQRLADERK